MGVPILGDDCATLQSTADRVPIWNFPRANSVGNFNSHTETRINFFPSMFEVPAWIAGRVARCQHASFKGLAATVAMYCNKSILDEIQTHLLFYPCSCRSSGSVDVVRHQALFHDSNGSARQRGIAGTTSNSRRQDRSDEINRTRHDRHTKPDSPEHQCFAGGLSAHCQRPAIGCC